MTFSLKIAFRYLFSKKSHNAINIVSLVSACGVCVGTVALVCVLSVYNGFESLVQSLFSEFDPDLKITAVEGKSFDVSELEKVRKMPEVAVFTEIIEENALIKYGDKQTPAVVMGVSGNFIEATHINNIMYQGNFLLRDANFDYAVAGVGLASQLSMGVSFIEPVSIYAPKRRARINLARPETAFNQKYVHLSGIFSVKQADYDDKYLLIPIELAREIYEYAPRTVTAVDLKLLENADNSKVQTSVKQTLGNEFLVQNRYEQQEDYFRIMKVEKWISYLILAFILLIAVFNIIGSLSMLIIEKQSDISTLRNMGANNKQIRRIFLYEGWLISLLGAAMGIVIGVALCLAQEIFGIVTLGNGTSEFVVNAYPIELQAIDLLVVFVTVALLGFLAVWYAIKNLTRA
ncbi:membrane protein [Bacteroidia bacterium]|nr:membrane protein [Bacteroidia bacterium]